VATPSDNLTLHRYKRINQGYTEDLGDQVTLTLMLIPAGEFMMGAPQDEPDSRDNERPQHLVKMPQFLMGRYPVTQAQWRVVAGYDRVKTDLKSSPSRFKGDDLPVEQVNWHQATEFCQRLSIKTQKNYHLPSEAQWEYACRAETTTAYHFGDQLTTELANYERSVGQTTAVGTYPANRWGLFDMHGNVWEWCQDHWHDNYEGAPSDGSAFVEGGDSKYRVHRGGSWYFNPRSSSSTYRFFNEPGRDLNDFGLRVCCTAARKQAKPWGP
jgi:formylglycine-generating enzyme required for sulfatase activity